MPAILRNVAKTDTLETQRQKINLLAQDVYSIGSGGSDLSAGNIKLGDGTRVAPSLSFSSDNTLGIYKPAAKTIGYVSDGKKVADFAPTGFYSFRDLILQQKKLLNAGISILNIGTNYDSGSYSNIPLVGGTGENATANITVTKFAGVVNNAGKNYTPGTYTNIPLVGGSGTGATANFTVDSLSGSILTAGSGYVSGSYQNVSLTGGTGSGATANITIAGGATISGSITNQGSGYTPGQYSQLPIFNLPKQTFVVTAISNPGTPPPNDVYVIDSVTQQSLTLEKGNTYRFDVSSSSVATHPLAFRTSGNLPLSQDFYNVTSIGTPGTAGAYIYLVIKPDAPTETIQYICSVHAGMGANISIVSGTSGNYGSGGSAQAVVNSSGNVTSFSFSAAGEDYKQNDVVTAFIPGGSGFLYTVSGINYNGSVTSVIIINQGTNYSNADILSFNNSSVGGFGSGFQYAISTDPGIISDLSFASKGNNYQNNDILSLSGSVNNISTTLKGQVTNVSSTVSTSSAIITLASTSGIIAGMNIDVLQGSVGSLPANTTVLSVDSNTQVTLSSLPTSAGSIILRFYSSGNLNEITVSSTAGIYVNSLVQKVSGVGTLAANTRVQSVNTNTNTIILTDTPSLAGSIIVNFIPSYGIGDGLFEYQITSVGSIESFAISQGGNGYSVNDQLSVNPSDLTQPIIYTVGSLSTQKLELSTPVPTNTFSVGGLVKLRDQSVLTTSTTSSTVITPIVVSGITTTLSNSSPIITVANTAGITQGMIVTQAQGETGSLSQGTTTVLSVNSSTQLTLSATPLTSGSATLTFTSNQSGNYNNVASTTNSINGTGATFNVTRQSNGVIQNIVVNNGGYFYQVGDTITISGSLVGGSSPTDNIVLSVSSIFESESVEIYDLETSGSNIVSLLVNTPASVFLDNSIIRKTTSTQTYTISNADDPKFKFRINTGSGLVLAPDLTLYSGNTYKFDINSISSTHDFAFSKYQGGSYSPSLIQNISSNLSNTTNSITVSNTAGISAGMLVSVTSGSGALVAGTVVSSVVNSTTIILSSNPLTSGPVVLTFSGVEYTDNVTRDSNYLTIRITNDTPDLYYYCKRSGAAHSEEGKRFSGHALLTTDNNNPKVFGSQFLVSVASLESSDIIKANILNGELKSTSIISTTGTFATLNADNVVSTNITSTSLTVSSISSSGNLALNASNFNIASNLNIGSTIQIVNSTGNITTSGIVKTTNSLNINDKLIVTDNIVSSTAGNNIIFTPAIGRITKINTTTALTIPSGTTAQRPVSGVVENGSIRFNTDTGQYEGYSGATSSWSSLGGVRDLDGNTYISAEASVGANDNTLYFYNDGNNTIKFSPTKFTFNTVKVIDSPNVLNPPSTEWIANTPVALNSYIFYGLNLYKVTTAGSLSTIGNEPTHTSGTQLNGTAQLEWYSEYASDVTFDKVKNVNIKNNLIFNEELKLFNNKITTLLSDVIIEPFAGKKVDINTNTSLVLPNGTTAERGIPGQGSVRFNTSLSQFEGYNGTNWTSLGGVRDVDGNTYIIPETAPGANENILYFYNNGSNTLRLSTTELTFNSIDQIGSTSNNLDLQASTVTFNNLSLTLDTTSVSTNRLLSTKTNFDVALSSGLTTDSLLRLTNEGDIYINKTFGTGSDTLIKVLDNELNKFELDDLIIESSEYTLTKGTTNSGASVIFNPTLHSGAKVVLIADNTTINDREMIEFTVISKGTDIFHTEYGNVVSNGDIITPTFDFDASNNVRLNTALVSGVATGNVVNITVVSTVIKK